MKWISVEDRLPTGSETPCAVILNGKVHRCCGFIREAPEFTHKGETFMAQPAEWWLDCEGINTVESGVTHWMPLPPPPGDEQ